MDNPGFIVRVPSPAAAATRRRLLQSGGAGAIAASVLAACTTSPAGPGPASKQPVTLRWSFYNEQPLMDTAAKAIPAFTAKYPYITVNQEPKPGSGFQLEPELIAGSGPDVLASSRFSLPVWARQGLLANLDPFLKRDGKEVPVADYAPALMQFWHTPERGQFALPMAAWTRALFYNRTLFKRRGIPFPDATWDWNRLRDVSVQLNEPAQGRFGWYMLVAYAHTGHFIRGNGGHHVDPKDNTKAAFDSPPALEALQWLHDRMSKDHGYAHPNDLKPFFDVTKGSTGAVLAQGNLAMITEGAWYVPRLATEMPELSEHWDVTVQPKGPVQRDTHASTDGWAIFAGSKVKDDAWNLMKFLQSEPWLEPAIAVAGHQPARKSWLDRYSTLMKKAYPVLADKNLAAFTDATKDNYARPEELFKKHVESQKVFEDTLQAVLVRNERPVADAFREAARQVNALNAAS